MPIVDASVCFNIDFVVVKLNVSVKLMHLFICFMYFHQKAKLLRNKVKLHMLTMHVGLKCSGII